MATYLQGVTDNQLPVQIYQPDYSFLQQMSAIKASQYRQGQQQLGSAYQNVLNSPITGDENKEVRRKYLQQAQDSLDKIASSDLSLPQNVALANKVFSPFWEDEDLLRDMHLTKTQAKENELYQSDMSSKEDNIRKRANPIVAEWMNITTEELKNRKRGEAFPEIRRYTPWIDLVGQMNQSVKDDGYKFSQTYNKQWESKTVTNGPTSIPYYTAIAQANVTPEILNQYKIIAEVQTNRAVKAIINENPEMDKKQALHYYNETNYNEIKNDYMSNMKFYNDQLVAIKDKINILKAKPTSTWTEDDVDHYNNYIALRDNIYETSKETEAKLNKHLDKESILEEMNTTPGSYYGQGLLSKQLKNWALGKAAEYSEKTEENKAFSAMISDLRKVQELEETRRYHTESLENQRLIAAMKGKKTVNPDGSITVDNTTEEGTTPGTPGSGSAVIGYSPNDFTKEKPLDITVNKINNLKDERRKIALSNNGMSAILLDYVGDGDKTKALTTISALSSGMLSGNTNTPQFKTALKDVNQVFQRNGIKAAHDEATYLEGLHHLLVKKEQDYTSKDPNAAHESVSPNMVSAHMALLNHNELVKQELKLRQKMDSDMNSTIDILSKENSNYGILKVHNKQSLINKYFSKLNIPNKSAADLYTDWTSGTLTPGKYKDRPDVANLISKLESEVGLSGSKYGSMMYDVQEATNNRLISSPNTKDITSGVVLSYNIGKPPKSGDMPEVGARILTALSLGGNQIRVDDKDYKDVNDSTKQVIEAFLKNPYLYGGENSTINYNTLSKTFTFNLKVGEGNKQTNPKVEITLQNLNQGQGNNVLNQILPSVNDLITYDNVYNGETWKTDDFIKKYLHFDASIVPFKEQGTYVLQLNSYVPKIENGRVSWVPDPNNTQREKTVSMNVVSPDALIGGFYSALQAHIQRVNDIFQNYNNGKTINTNQQSNYYNVPGLNLTRPGY